MIPKLISKLKGTVPFSAAAFSAVALLTACSPAAEDSEPTADPEPAVTADRPDVHSFARPDEAAVKHLSLDLDVDFDAKTLNGRASLHLERGADAEFLHLDTRDLDIRGISWSTEPDGEVQNAEFELGDDRGYLGKELRVKLVPGAEVIHVDYVTKPDGAAAVQWLDPAQTKGGEHPFLFTQSQAILARTWVPIQDTPAVRFTYDATVKVPADLLAVMSAENPQAKNAEGVYTFQMPQAIPSYLLALAVGDLEFLSMGERTGVYAEPAVVKEAAWEFSETEQMMEVAEELYGPYRWGRFDILVLPPSFPFGGMENPRLTFATPTILAGDRSLVALIAHELAHSWSGNLVTNATWNDFWLNEGFTVYLERRIMEAVKGENYAGMLAVLGRQDLDHTLEGFGPDHRDSHLFLDLENRDPDEGMTDVAYEKGYFFLRTVEEAVGRERFDAFLRSWFDGSSFQSRTTDQFVSYLEDQLIRGDEELAEAIDLKAWIYGPGVPDNAPTLESDAFAQVDAARQGFLDDKSAAAIETGDWTTHHWLHFLRGIPYDVGGETMARLDEAFAFSKTGNSEILHEWLLHAIGSHYEPAYGALEDFLTRQGRRKFLKPLYEAMAEDEKLRPMAEKIYDEARPGYHSVSTGTIDELLGR